jgi:hypothetical protein
VELDDSQTSISMSRAARDFSLIGAAFAASACASGGRGRRHLA